MLHTNSFSYICKLEHESCEKIGTSPERNSSECLELLFEKCTVSPLLLGVFTTAVMMCAWEFWALSFIAPSRRGTTVTLLVVAVLPTQL